MVGSIVHSEGWIDVGILIPSPLATVIFAIAASSKDRKGKYVGYIHKRCEAMEHFLKQLHK
jgi:hypothetical protein